MTDLESSIQFLPGVGPKRAELIARELGVGTLGELIRIYPFRYVDRSRITPIAAIDSCAAAIQIRARVVRATLYGQGSAVIARNEFSPDGTLVSRTLARETVNGVPRQQLPYPGAGQLPDALWSSSR